MDDINTRKKQEPPPQQQQAPPSSRVRSMLDYDADIPDNSFCFSSAFDLSKLSAQVDNTNNEIVFSLDRTADDPRSKALTNWSDLASAMAEERSNFHEQQASLLQALDRGVSLALYALSRSLTHERTRASLSLSHSLTHSIMMVVLPTARSASAKPQ